MLEEILSLKHYSIEEMRKEKLSNCPVCQIETRLTMSFSCVHCNTVHHIFECPKCKNNVIVPEDVVTIKVTENG